MYKSPEKSPFLRELLHTVILKTRNVNKYIYYISIFT